MGARFQSHQKQKKIISELIVRVVKPLLLGFIFIICTGWWPLHFTVLSWYQEVVAWGAQLILKLSQIKHPESWAGFWADDACASQWLGLLSLLFNWWLDTNFYGFIRRLLLFQIRAAKRWYFNRIQKNTLGCVRGVILTRLLKLEELSSRGPPHRHLYISTLLFSASVSSRWGGLHFGLIVWYYVFRWWLFRLLLPTRTFQCPEGVNTDPLVV